MAQKTIAVIGSLNVDFITRTPRVPEAGETLAATSFDTGFGGKGANQAVACARLAPPDVKVRMVGNVGDDIFGNDYLRGLRKEGIDASSVKKLNDQKTGVANIIVDEVSGDNRILITANANNAFSAERDEGWDLIPKDANMAVFQLEIPLAVVSMQWSDSWNTHSNLRKVLHNMHQAQERGKHVLFNPAPAVPLPGSAYRDIDTLILNETESELLITAQDQDLILTAEERAPFFLKAGVKEAVIITLGSEGLIYATTSGASGRLAARKVKAVDTTAAGDTFVGAYAVQRVQHSEGVFDYAKALEFATLAASKSVEKAGAMDSIPFLKDVVL